MQSRNPVPEFRVIKWIQTHSGNSFNGVSPAGIQRANRLQVDGFW